MSAVVVAVVKRESARELVRPKSPGKVLFPQFLEWALSIQVVGIKAVYWQRSTPLLA